MLTEHLLSSTNLIRPDTHALISANHTLTTVLFLSLFNATFSHVVLLVGDFTV